MRVEGVVKLFYRSFCSNRRTSTCGTSPKWSIVACVYKHMKTTSLVAFAGAGQRRRTIRVVDVLSVWWATGDLPEECPFRFSTRN